jgi:hypothetical protein
MYHIASAEVNYVSTHLTNGTWTQLTLLDPTGVALSPNALPKNINKLKITDSSGLPIQIGVGATASPGAVTGVAIINPNADGDIDLLLSKGLSIYIQPSESTAVANEGKLNISFLKGRLG